MNNQDFTATISVDKTPKEAFDAINNARGWWSEEIEGGTDKLGDEFTYHYKDVHRCKMKLVEVIPDKRVVWIVLDNCFNFCSNAWGSFINGSLRSLITTGKGHPNQKQK